MTFVIVFVYFDVSEVCQLLSADEYIIVGDVQECLGTFHQYIGLYYSIQDSKIEG